MTTAFFFINAIERSFCSVLSPTARRKCYATWMWILTYIVYASYHLSRKPISVVKNVLNENCSKLTPPSPTNDSTWCDWKPFDGNNSSTLLGTLDSAYLFTYAIGMFFSGVIAERSRLNVFLSVGMISSGIMTVAFGLGYTFNIHAFWYFLFVQLLCGIVQSSGWPGVVTVMGNWFGKKKRGLIMGIWNSHTSVGNILGTLIASAFLNVGWDLSFVIPGIIIATLGILVLFFLIPEPMDVGIENPNSITENPSDNDCDEIRTPLLPNHENHGPERTRNNCNNEAPIKFLDALKIPGVVEFSLSLFFSKLVSYTFLYWLPNFIFDSTSSSADQSGEISTFYDFGGIAGGILAGVLSDTTGMPASTCSLMLVFAIPMIYIYQLLNQSVTIVGNILLLIPVGLLVNGPYSLITTAVSAELGTHSCLSGNSKALSTVTSIIDGTGSLGAAIGPLIAGVLSNGGRWSNVFYMMIVADIFSLLFLVRLMKKELSRFF